MGVYWWGVWLYLYELYDWLWLYGLFVDVVVGGGICGVCKVNVFMFDVGEVCVLIDVTAGIWVVCFLCSGLVGLLVLEFLEAGV
jgi:hypothetical protein